MSERHQLSLIQKLQASIWFAPYFLLLWRMSRSVFLLLPLSWGRPGDAPSVRLPLRLEVLLHQANLASTLGGQLVCTTHHAPLTCHWVMSLTSYRSVTTPLASQVFVPPSEMPHDHFFLASQHLAKVVRRTQYDSIFEGFFVCFFNHASPDLKMTYGCAQVQDILYFSIFLGK